MDSDVCKCGEETDPKEVRVQCTNCKRHFHKTCANPFFANYTGITLPKHFDDWWCTQCLVLRDIDEGNQVLINSLTSKLAPHFEARFDDLSKEMDGKVNQLNDQIESKILAVLQSFFPDRSPSLPNPSTATASPSLEILQDSIATPIKTSTSQIVTTPKSSTTYAALIDKPATPSADPTPIIPPTRPVLKSGPSLKLKVQCPNKNASKIAETLDRVLVSTPLNFLDCKGEDQIVIGFPSSTDMKSVSAKIAEETPVDVTVAPVTPTAKVTVLSVPLETKGVGKEALNKLVLDNLVSKNPWLSSDNTTVVDVKTHFKNKQLCNVGLRLPVDIQKRLLEEGKVYYGRSRLNVQERFYVQQCFKCQGYNHVSKDCTSDISVCKRCGGDHDVMKCGAPRTKFCVNCNQSAEHKANATTHFGGDHKCPVRLSIIDGMAKN